jgi:dehydrogenase/reductase SDR family protein 12
MLNPATDELLLSDKLSDSQRERLIMIRLQKTIEVPRPIDEVFRYTSDFSNIEQWDPGVSESSKLSAGLIGVGSRFRVIVKFGLSTTPMDYVITVYEPPQHVVLEGEGGSIHALDDIRFEATPTGTQIAYTADLSFTGLIGFTEPFLGGLMERVGQRAMAGLQTALSREPEVPSYGMLSYLMDRLILPGMLGFTRFGYRWHRRSWQPLTVSLQGKSAVVTGATSGLGRATAEGLAALGARVVLVGRDVAKAQQTREELIATTGNPDIGVEMADLSLLAEARALAQRLLQNEARVHILINNAGVLLDERSCTVEGIETTLATNLLAPFVLTNQLIPRLKASAPARIINVSSGGMYTTGIDLDDLQSARGTFNGSLAYARTKRGLVILTELWAEQLRDTGVVVHAMHPGWADTPGVKESLPGFYKLTKPFLRTPAEGADTIVWLAAAPEAGKVSGYFWLDREPHTTTVLLGTGGSESQRQQLWEALRQLSGEAPAVAG